MNFRYEWRGENLSKDLQEILNVNARMSSVLLDEFYQQILTKLLLGKEQETLIRIRVTLCCSSLVIYRLSFEYLFYLKFEDLQYLWKKSLKLLGFEFKFFSIIVHVYLYFIIFLFIGQFYTKVSFFQYFNFLWLKYCSLDTYNDILFNYDNLSNLRMS